MQDKTRYYMQLTLLGGILVILSFTPIGSIQLPLIKATTTHIPVIIGAILLGTNAGVILGILFGIVSVIRSTIFPTLTTFVFSPFLPVPGTDTGNWMALLVAFIPRILIGIVVSWLYRVLKKTKLSIGKRMVICSVAGSMVNTVGVLGLIYLFFGDAYAEALSVSYHALVPFLMSVVATNGLGEAVAAAVIAPAVCYGIIKSGYRTTGGRL